MEITPKRLAKTALGLVLLLFLGLPCRAQEFAQPVTDWRLFAVSVAAHGAGTGFDAWTSWQHLETNGLMSKNGRFTAASAGKKAGAFAAITVVQVVVLRKWGARHPWLEKAFTMANFSAGGMLASAGIRNLGVAGPR